MSALSIKKQRNKENFLILAVMTNQNDDYEVIVSN